MSSKEAYERCPPGPSLSQGIMKNTSLWDSRFELSLSAIQI